MDENIGVTGELSCVLKDRVKELNELVAEVCGAVHHNDTRIKKTLEAIQAERQKFQEDKSEIRTAVTAFANHMHRASNLVEDNWQKRFVNCTIAGVSGGAFLLFMLYLLQKFANIHFFFRLGQ